MKNILAVFIIAALLLAGCGAQAQSEGSIKAADNTKEKETMEKEMAKGEEGKMGKEPDSATKMGWDLAAMMQGGVSTKCQIEVKTGTGVQKTTIYVKGKKIRSEAQVEGKKLNSVIKNDEIYIYLSDNSDCDWMKISANATSGASKTVKVGTESGNSYETMSESTLKAPPMNYSCTAEVFGEEKFETAGKICDISQMTTIKTTSCDSIEDPEDKAQCEKILAGYR